MFTYINLAVYTVIQSCMRFLPRPTQGSVGPPAWFFFASGGGESYLDKTGILGLASAWAMARRMPMEYYRRVDAATAYGPILDLTLLWALSQYLNSLYHHHRWYKLFPYCFAPFETFLGRTLVLVPRPNI